MTRKEAMAVYCLCGSVYGSNNSPTKQIGTMFDTFHKLFGMFDTLGTEYPSHLREGEVTFKDYEVEKKPLTVDGIVVGKAYRVTKDYLGSDRYSKGYKNKVGDTVYVTYKGFSTMMVTNNPSLRKDYCNLSTGDFHLSFDAELAQFLEEID